MIKEPCFFPLEMSNTCINVLNPKITEKWLSIVTPPFFTHILFYQNDSELPKIDFKHNFENRKILIFDPPHGKKISGIFFLFKASLIEDFNLL